MLRYWLVMAPYCLAACKCAGVGRASFTEWASQAQSSCASPSGQGAAVHHVLIFPTSVSYFCRDTTADDPQLSRFNKEGFNLARCWTLSVAPNCRANTHIWKWKLAERDTRREKNTLVWIVRKRLPRVMLNDFTDALWPHHQYIQMKSLQRPKAAIVLFLNFFVRTNASFTKGPCISFSHYPFTWITAVGCNFQTNCPWS